MQHDFAARLCALAGFDGIAHHLVGEGLGEFRVEIYLMIVGPSPCAATGAEGVGVNGLEVHLVGSLILDGIIEVENHTCLFAFGIGEAIDGGALGGSDFSLHTIAVEQHAVVAWLGLFFALAKWRGIGHALCIGFFLADILDVSLTHDGHEKEVAQVGATCAAQACMGEAIERLVFVVVTGTGIPAVLARIGTGLYHTARHDGAWMGVAVASRTDKEVDILGVVARPSRQTGCHEQEDS